MLKKFKITFSTGNEQGVAYILAASKYDAKHRFHRIHPDYEIISLIDVKPCYGCTKRRVTSDYNCHSDCKDFKIYRDDIDKKNAIARKAKADSIAVLDVKSKRK